MTFTKCTILTRETTSQESQGKMMQGFAWIPTKSVLIGLQWGSAQAIQCTWLEPAVMQQVHAANLAVSAESALKVMPHAIIRTASMLDTSISHKKSGS